MHGGTVVTYSPPTSEVGGSNPGLYVVSCLLVSSLIYTDIICIELKTT